MIKDKELKEYASPELEIITFSSVNIVTASPGSDAVETEEDGF